MGMGMGMGMGIFRCMLQAYSLSALLYCNHSVWSFNLTPYDYPFGKLWNFLLTFLKDCGKTVNPSTHYLKHIEIASLKCP